MKQVKICLIEPNASAISSYYSLFKTNGYYWNLFTELPVAIGHIKLFPTKFDIVVTEINFKEYNIEDIIINLKEAIQTTPLIVTSAFNLPENLHKYFGLHYLKKPFEPLKLVELINNIFLFMHLL